MLHLRTRLSIFGLTASSVSVFYHTAVLLLLMHNCEGQFEVVGPQQPVIVKIGEDVILPCHLNPAVDARGMTFEWARPDLDPRFVHLWHERQDLLVNQHPSYKGRTSLSIDKMKHGDISLKLSKVKVADEGIYRCYFQHLEKDTNVQLVVGAAASPIISLAGIDRSSSGVILQCDSTGWYPEPEVFWLDGEGNLLSAGPPETVKGPDDLYTVSSRVTVEKRHSNSFTCRVTQKKTNQTRETQIQVPDDFFIAPCSSAAAVAVSLVSCFICGLVIGFAVWKWRQDQIKTKTTRQSEEEELRAKTNKIKEMENKLQRKERQYEYIVDSVKKHKVKLKEEKDRVEKQVERNEQEFESVKEKRSKSTTEQQNLDLEKIIGYYSGDLTDTQNELDQLVLATQSILANAEDESAAPAEKKKEGENYTDKDKSEQICEVEGSKDKTGHGVKH